MIARVAPKFGKSDKLPWPYIIYENRNRTVTPAGVMWVLAAGVVYFFDKSKRKGTIYTV